MFKLKKKSSGDSLSEQKRVLCTNLNFAAAEAYKLLRTNLMFSLPEQKCHVIGVSSAIRNEGKSTTSINLSYTLAETGKRVLLIEADMRLPHFARRLDLKTRPGLSNLLVGLSGENDVLQNSGFFDNWKVITAGAVPPNPSELLGSERMRDAIEKFSKTFDYIVIDLPPVNIVTDSLVVSKLVDGIILIARKDYSYRQSLQEAIGRFTVSGAKLLGLVLTHVDAPDKSYKKYSRYGRHGRYGRYGRYGKYGDGNEYGYEYGYGYGYRYGYGNGYGYGRNAKDPKKKKETGEGASVTASD